MKKFVAVVAAVLFVGALVAPVIAQAQAASQAPKGTEGPDVRKAKKKTAASPAPKVEPKGTEGPGIRKQEPKGTEGPDVRKSKTAGSQAPKGTEGPDVRKV